MQPFNVIGTFEYRFCSVCTSSSASLYLNIYQNVISFRSKLISLAQIIQETLNLQLDEQAQQSHEMCASCKQKIVEFYIFKKIHEEARKVFNESAAISSSRKALLLKPIEQQADDDCEEIIDGCDDMSDTGCLLDLSSLKEKEDVISELEAAAADNPKIELSTTSRAIEARKNVDASTKEFSEKWKRNSRKLAKNSGKSYVSSAGKLVKAKEMKASCGTCRLNCARNLSEEHRLRNFRNFYDLGDIRRQRKFLFEHIKSFTPKKGVLKRNSKRKVQRSYYLEVRSENGKMKMTQVCKKMFLNTLSISSQMIATLQRKLEQGKIEDRRGKYERRGIK